mgnify:CR=1 FL=1
MTTTLRKIRTITSHVGISRFYAECDERPAGMILDSHRVAHGIRSPYACGPDWTVWTWNMPATGQAVPVVIFETSHKRYEVFQVLHGVTLPVEEVR